MWQRPFTLCLLLSLTACGGGMIDAPIMPTTPNNKTEDPANDLSQVRFKDNGLQTCLEREIAFFHWVSSKDITHFTCDFVHKVRIGHFYDGPQDLSELILFPALSRLDLAGGAYTQLDVRPFSQLKTLIVNSAFIKTLDVSQNPQLENLDISATPIETLDIRGLTQFKYLDMGNTPVFEPLNDPLTNIDSSDQYLDLVLTQYGPSLGLSLADIKKPKTLILDSNTQITQIKHTQLAAYPDVLPPAIPHVLLSSLTFKDPALQTCVERQALNKNWTTLAEFTELNCSGLDKIRLLDVPAIRDLTGLSQLIALKSLNIPGHFYTHIDLSPFPQLEHLNLYGSFIKTLDVSHNPLLRTLNVGATALEFLDLTAQTHLEQLDTHIMAEGFHPSYTFDALTHYAPTYGITLKDVTTLARHIKWTPEVKLTFTHNPAPAQ